MASVTVTVDQIPNGVIPNGVKHESSSSSSLSSSSSTSSTFSVSFEEVQVKRQKKDGTTTPEDMLLSQKLEDKMRAALTSELQKMESDLQKMDLGCAFEVTNLTSSANSSANSSEAPVPISSSEPSVKSSPSPSSPSEPKSESPIANSSSPFSISAVISSSDNKASDTKSIANNKEIERVKEQGVKENNHEKKKEKKSESWSTITDLVEKEENELKLNGALNGPLTNAGGKDAERSLADLSLVFAPPNSTKFAAFSFSSSSFSSSSASSSSSSSSSASTSANTEFSFSANPFHSVSQFAGSSFSTPMIAHNGLNNGNGSNGLNGLNGNKKRNKIIGPANHANHSNSSKDEKSEKSEQKDKMMEYLEKTWRTNLREYNQLRSPLLKFQRQCPKLSFRKFDCCTNLQCLYLHEWCLAPKNPDGMCKFDKKCDRIHFSAYRGLPSYYKEAKGAYLFDKHGFNQFKNDRENLTKTYLKKIQEEGSKFDQREFQRISQQFDETNKDLIALIKLYNEEMKRSQILTECKKKQCKSIKDGVLNCHFGINCKYGHNWCFMMACGGQGCSFVHRGPDEFEDLWNDQQFYGWTKFIPSLKTQEKNQFKGKVDNVDGYWIAIKPHERNLKEKEKSSKENSKENSNKERERSRFFKLKVPVKVVQLRTLALNLRFYFKNFGLQFEPVLDQSLVSPKNSLNKRFHGDLHGVQTQGALIFNDDESKAQMSSEQKDERIRKLVFNIHFLNYLNQHMYNNDQDKKNKPKPELIAKVKLVMLKTCMSPTHFFKTIEDVNSITWDMNLVPKIPSFAEAVSILAQPHLYTL